jgi:hypothetical protein
MQAPGASSVPLPPKREVRAAARDGTCAAPRVRQNGSGTSRLRLQGSRSPSVVRGPLAHRRWRLRKEARLRARLLCRFPRFSTGGGNSSANARSAVAKGAGANAAARTMVLSPPCVRNARLEARVKRRPSLGRARSALGSPRTCSDSREVPGPRCSYGTSGVALTELTDAVNGLNVSRAGDPPLSCSLSQTSDLSLSGVGNPNTNTVVGGGTAELFVCGIPVVPVETNFALDARVDKTSNGSAGTGTFNVTITEGGASFHDSRVRRRRGRVWGSSLVVDTTASSPTTVSCEQPKHGRPSAGVNSTSARSPSSTSCNRTRG